MKNNSDDSVQICGVTLTSTTKSRVLKQLSTQLDDVAWKRLITLVTPNSEQIVQANDDDSFRSILNGSSFSLPDGVGVVMASRVLAGWPQSAHLGGKKRHDRASTRGRAVLPERLTGIDMMESLCALAADRGERVFLLGGRGQAARRAAQRLEKRFPGLLVDSWPGATVVARERPQERRETLKRIKAHKTTILFVAYGAPWQEQWVWRNREVLQQAGVRVAMVVGGAFDVISGSISRAPNWVQMMGFEWLWRLFQEPWRWKRQLRLFRFWGLVMREAMMGSGK